MAAPAGSRPPFNSTSVYGDARGGEGHFEGPLVRMWQPHHGHAPDSATTRTARQFNESIVQSWEPAQSRYLSHWEYISHPIGRRPAPLWNREESQEYSSRKKAFSPVVPYNTQSFHYAPAMGNFDLSPLRQTDVLRMIDQPRPSQQFGTVSLADTIRPLVNKMGTMEDRKTKENLGTCTLIAQNLVLVARHTVEGRNIRQLHVTFGYTKLNGSFYSSGETSMDRVVEENPLSDYAIIQLKEPLGNHLGFVSLNTEGCTIAEPALLHYPLGKPLQVSVHKFVQTTYQTEHLLPYHDSDSFSSGGAYFDPTGRMIAIHLGTQPEWEEETMGLLRCAQPLEEIVTKNPNSLLAKFARDPRSQACSYTSNADSFYLAPTHHNSFINEEGRESEKILRQHLPKGWETDAKIKRTKEGTISFSKSNLTYIADAYSTEYEQFKKECLGKAGNHNVTRLFSAVGVIESDHTIPHDVWKSTTNPKMNEVVTRGRGARPGENDMPAITIPWEIHRSLLTTGNGQNQEQFRQKLTHLCDQGDVHEALIECYRDYKNKGLNFSDYQTSIKQSIEAYVNLGLISAEEKEKILSSEDLF